MRWLMRFFLMGLVLAVAGCGRELPQNLPVEQTWLTMGTFAVVRLRADDKDLLRECFLTTAECFSNINAKLSTYISDSEISRLNASGDKVPVSAVTYDVLRTTLRYCVLTGGAFDPTVKPLIKLWGFNGARVPTNLPSASDINGALKTVGYRKVHLEERFVDGEVLFLAQSPVEVDLGGIAKGYAVDRAYEMLVGECAFGQGGRPNMLINLGGNIRCHGQASAERFWRIGVRNPFDNNGLVGVVDLGSGMAVATSGDYERYVVVEGRRYAHIIDPRSGYPVQGMAEVTVVSTNATEADAMSTSVYVAGLEGAKALLEKLPGCRAILIPAKRPMEIWVTPNMKSIFTVYDEYRNSVREF